MRSSTFSSWVLTTLMMAVAAASVSGSSRASDVATAILLAFGGIVAVTPRARELPLYILSALTLAAVLLFAADPLAVAWKGMQLGGVYASLVLALGFLQAPASRSKLVRRTGEYLIRQGPGRRYLALTGGAHLFGIVLSIGSLGLLGEMVKQSNTLENAGGDRRVMEIRERRMVTAMLRGFSTVTSWSSSSLAPAIVLSMVPSVTWPQMIPYGVALAVGSMAIGWAMDRFTYSAAARLRVNVPGPIDRATQTLLPMCGIVAALMVAILVTKQAFGWSLSTAIIVMVPVAATVWLLLQNGRHGAAAAVRVTVQHMAGHARQLERMRYEVVALSTAGFIGVGVGALLPPDAMARVMETLSLPPAALLIAASAVIGGAALVGVNPIVGATVIGSALAQASDAIPPMALVIALLGPWTTYVAGSPLSASSLTLGRIFGHTPETVGLRWNGTFLVLTFLLQVLFILVLVEIG